MKISFKIKGVAWLLGAALVGTVAGCGGGGSSSKPSANVGEIVFVGRDSGDVFQSFSKLFTINLDGSKLTPIPKTVEPESTVSSVSWFPGRREIAYDSFTDNGTIGNSTIRRANRNGTNNREIVPDSAFDAKISPDGRRIAYAFYTVATPAVPTAIFIANADGTSPVRLVNGSNPSWSPDGRRIVYRSVGKSINGVFQGDLSTININGTNQKVLINTPEDEFDAQWSPDGKSIVYTSALYVSTIKRNLRIFTINPDGSNRKQLTDNATLSTLARWTLDGKRIVYRSSFDQINIMNADGSGQKKLFKPGLDIGFFDLR